MLLLFLVNAIILATNKCKIIAKQVAIIFSAVQFILATNGISSIERLFDAII